MRLAFVLSLLSAVVWAVFEDEAGKIDIHFPLIGCPAKLAFHSPIAGQGSLCYALTDRSIVAALSCRTGDIIWRQRAVSNSSFEQFKVTGQVLVTSSDDGAVIGWSALNGSALWTRQFPRSESHLLSLSVDQDNVYTAGAEKITALRLLDGVELWQASTASDTAIESAILGQDSSELFLATMSSSSNGIAIEQFEKSSGKSTHKSAISTETGFSSENVHVSSSAACPVLIYKSSDKNDIVAKNIRIGNTAILKTEQAYESFSTQLECTEEQTIVLAQYSKADGTTWAEVYTISAASASIASSYHIPALKIPSAFKIARGGKEWYIVRISAESSSGKIEIWSSQSHGRLASYDIALNDTQVAQFTQMDAEVSEVEGNSNVMARVMFSTSNCGFQMWRGSSLDWTRPEGLSKVKKVILIALPERQSFKVMSDVSGNIIADFFSRSQRHVSQLLSLISRTTQSGDELDELPVRDHFGLRQYAISMSDDEIFAIDTLGSRQVVWSRSLHSTGLVILDAREKALEDLQVSSAPSIILVTKAADGLFEIEIDVLSGAFDTSKRVNVDAGSTKHNSTVQIDVSATMVSGKSTKSEETSTWELRLPADNHVVAKALSSEHEQIASVGRVLGDRGVLYKYLDQIVAIITINELKGSLTAYLLSAQDGRILHQATHMNVGTSKPVNVVLMENRLAYHFWAGAETNAYQMVVTELYQGPRNARLSDAKADLHAISQSFIYDHEIDAMTVTTSKQGITSREIVVALKSGQVTTIPRRLLDPRRPTSEKLSAADKEEMLLPYKAVIDVEPRAVLSHKLEVLGIKNIFAAPTLLESTGLICAYGLDIFITRVTPSMPYDILSDSFSKAQIVLSLSLLLVAIIVTRPMAARKTLTRRWVG